MSDAFIERNGNTVRETVNATKERFGADALEDLFAGASKVYAARGKKIVEVKMTGNPDALEEVTKVALGPSGNLRAPTIRTGKTWVVGFNEDLYTERL